ncbi:MAG: hypothetical protein AAFR72_13840, partial [Pseudomonadota bacterium]
SNDWAPDDAGDGTPGSPGAMVAGAGVDGGMGSDGAGAGGALEVSGRGMGFLMKRHWRYSPDQRRLPTTIRETERGRRRTCEANQNTRAGPGCFLPPTARGQD